MPLVQQAIASPFNASSTTDAVLKGIDLTGKNIIITGASAGLGAETARALAAAGATIIMAVRSVEKGKAVAEKIQQTCGIKKIEVDYLDLRVWDSVYKFAGNILARDIPVHVLINNAGLQLAKKEFIDGNIEAQFGINHLGHMLLSCLLAPALLKGTPARVVCLSSAAHRRIPARFDDINFEQRPYEKLESYSISKSANSLFAVEFNRRLEHKGVTSYAVNPGPVFTDMQNVFSKQELRDLNFHDENGNVAPWFKPAEVGAATSVWCATSPLLNDGGGVYCEDCNISAVKQPDNTVAKPSPTSLVGVLPWAIDPGLAKELWALSEDMLGQRFEF